MPTFSRKLGSTSTIIPVFIQDSSVATGAGKAGLTSGSVTCYYKRDTATSAAVVSLVTTSLGSWTSGGFLEVDGTNMPGEYEFQAPDAAFSAATAAKSVSILIKGTGVAPCRVLVELTQTDNQDVVRGGMTALPAAVPGASGGVFIAGSNAATTVNITGNITGNLSGSVGSVTGAVGSVTGAVGSVTGAVGSVTSAVTVTGTPAVNVTQWGGAAIATPLVAGYPLVDNGKWLGGTIPSVAVTGVPKVDVADWIGNPPNALSSGLVQTTAPSSASIATTIWQDTTASGDFGTAGSIGLLLKTAIPAVTAGQAGGIFIAGSNAATTVNITGNITGNLSGSVGSVTGAVGSVTGAVGSVTGAVGSVTGSVGSVTGAVGSVTAGVTVTTNNDKSGYSLVVSPPTVAQIATAVWQDATAGDFTATGSIGKFIKTDGVPVATGTGTGQINLSSGNVALAAAGLDLIVIESGINARQALQLSAAALSGTVSGAGGTTVTITGSGVSNVNTRIVATVDADGNRTPTTISPT